jgi:hypothetical protein
LHGLRSNKSSLTALSQIDLSNPYAWARIVGLSISVAAYQPRTVAADRVAMAVLPNFGSMWFSKARCSGCGFAA